MKIVQLAAENIKRLTAVEITPDGSTVIIGGKNGAGKSSVLDSIAYALGGAKLLPTKPIRTGQSRAKVRVDLGEYIVTRTFTAAGGGTLTVTNTAGAKFPSPQALLDTLLGTLTFDPLAFIDLDPKRQRELLRQLVGLDTSALDAERQRLFETRTDVQREVRTLTGQLAGMPAVAEAPDDEIALADVAKEIEAAEGVRADAVSAARDVELAEKTLERLDLEAGQLAEEIAALTARHAAIVDVERPLAQAMYDEKYATAAAAEVAVPDVSALRARLLDVERINARVRANRARRTVEQDRLAQEREADTLTARIGAIDAEKLAAIAAVAFPVPDLSLTDDGVTYRGEPFEQASTAEQIRVSVAIGLALNPTLKVLLVRNGSNLDSTSMALLAQLADAHDAQVWIERVAESAEGVTVLIEDGAVVDDAVTEGAPA